MSWRESDFVVGACGGAVDLATANDTTARLQRIRRKAQRNFQFATIYEQRKTREILIAGYLPGTGRDFRRVTSGRPLRVRPRSQASIGPKVHHVAAGCLDRIALGVGLEPLHQRNKFALCATPRSRSSSPRLRRAALHSLLIVFRRHLGRWHSHYFRSFVRSKACVSAEPKRRLSHCCCEDVDTKTALLIIIVALVQSSES